MFYTLKRTVEIIQKESMLSLVRKFLLYPIQFFNCLFKIRNLKRDFDPVKLVDFVFTKCSGLIKPFQVKDEILKLLIILNKMKPKTMLEIGTATGGTLFLFSRIISKEGNIITIDLPGGRFGGGYPIWKIPLYKSFALDKQQIHLIRADSHENRTLEKVRSILNGKEIDFLFIDGDHTYQGVKKDFEIYNSLVKKNGIIAIHDIIISPHEIDCQVNKFWNEIKTRYEYMEIVNNLGQNWAGIGLLFV